MTNPGSVQGNTPAPAQNTIVANNFQTLNELDVTVTVDSTNGNAVNLLIFPGPCPGKITGANEADGTHKVISSSASSTYAEYKNYLLAVGLHISYMRIQTDNTLNFSGNIYMGELPPNGNINPAKIPLSTYRQSVGTGYADTLTISDQKFANSRNFYLYIDKLIAPGSGTSTTNFYFGFSQISNSSTFQAPNN